MTVKITQKTIDLGECEARNCLNNVEGLCVIHRTIEAEAKELYEAGEIESINEYDECNYDDLVDSLCEVCGEELVNDVDIDIDTGVTYTVTSRCPNGH